MRGRESNFEAGRVMNHVYFTATLDAAVWGAELGAGPGRGHIYVVEPTGEFEDDPNVTDKRFPATRRSRSEVASRCAWWVRSSTGWAHSAEKLAGMLDGLTGLREQGEAVIDD